jgi:hypothetical protein
MNFIAFKRLTGERAKYIGLIVTIAFCTFLLENQTSILAGILKRTGSQIADVTKPSRLWIRTRNTLSKPWLLRIRTSPGRVVSMACNGPLNRVRPQIARRHSAATENSRFT